MGTPKPSIQWYKDDVEIFACDRIEMREEDEGGAVVLKEARLSDSGTIKCVASNILGRCTSTALFSIEGIFVKLKYISGIFFHSHSGPENLKKLRPKKLVKSYKYFFCNFKNGPKSIFF